MKKCIVFIALFFFIFVFSMNYILAQEKDSVRYLKIKPVKQDISIALRDMKPCTPLSYEPKVWNEKEKERLYPNYRTAKPRGPDRYRQKRKGTLKPVNINFLTIDGIPQLPGCGAPPDCNGAAGLNHYVQIVNSAFKVYDKQGVPVFGPVFTNTIWQGLPGGDDLGPDPVILWDDQAKRWFVTQMGAGGYFLLMAVSVTDDPTGQWYRYSWSWPDLPDYPKFSIWRDGYYCSLQCGSWDLGVFNRDQILSGGGVDGWLVDDPYLKESGGLCPIDNDGKWAPAGSPGLFITLNDDAWFQWAPVLNYQDELWLFEMKVTWGPSGSISFHRTLRLPVGDFDTNFGPFRDNITQKGTAQKLDAIPMVIMFRGQYRNFDTYQSIVCCHTVDVDHSNHAGIRWYELRKTTGNWYVYQQGTYAPDGHSRFMGSIAMNKYGDIALGYSVSSSSKYPSIAYTGRRKSDPLGMMTISEKYLWLGQCSQTTFNRWGDYSCMSVDPANDVNFWFTTEYSDGPDKPWRTHIGSFVISQ